MSESITRDEWLKALGEPEAQDPAALTVGELSAILGLGATATRDRVKRLVVDGKATRTYKRVRSSAGQLVRVPAYTLVAHASRPATRKERKVK